MMRRLAARRSDPLFSSTSSSSNNINAGSSNDNLHHLIIGNNNNSPSRRSPSNHNIKLSLSDDDATAKTPRHALCRNCRRITTLLSSLLSRCCSLYHRLKRMDPMYAATICIFLFVAIYTLVILSEIIFKFGPRGSIKGGLFGCILDQYIKDYTKYQTMSKWKDQVTNELHLPIVYKEQGGALIDKRWLPFGNSLSSRPNLAIVEMLLREKRRKVLLGKMIHDAVKDVKVCSSSNNNKQKKKKIFVANNNESDSSSSVLAGVVLQLQTKTSGQQPQQLLPYWLANIPALYNNGGVEAVTVDHSDIVPTDLLNDQLFQLHGQLLQLELNYSQERRRKGEQGRDDFSISSSIPQSIQNCAKFIANYNNNNNKDKYYYATRTDPTLHCLGYFLGGMQLGDDYQLLQQVRPHITNIFTIPSLYKHHATKSSSSASSPSCTSKVGYAVLSHTPTPEDQVRKSSSIWNHVSTIFSAFPPNHPAYLCLPPLHPNQVGISPYNTANEEISFQSTFVNQLVTAYESKRLDNLSSSSSSESIIWGVATLPCDFNDFSDVENAASCCNMVSVTMLDSITEGKSVEHYHLKNNAREDKLSHHLVFTFVTVPELDRSDNSRIIETPMQVSVSISERNPQQHKRTQASQYKESIQTKMRQKSWRCEPGWWCNRCLNAALYGSFSNCSFICGKCAPEFICNEREKGRQIDINVKVTGMNLAQTSVPAVNTMKWHHQRIPRIIHQTYFEDITKEKFPQLFRLQNTWKASGWEYRFYSDDTARNYIRTHYPERFVSVFDTLLPGAYKADFFRYLVLFREGGIYADIDVMLDANLDQFITPDLAFFAPIDSVGAYADEIFCLWNGLIGSAPAHPALANAIEWMVNLVSSRGDLYDVERAVCEVTGVDKLENWKIRAEAGLILSGPCALGFAVNNALGKETLSKFVPGLMRSSPITSARGSVHRESDDVIGDVMILVADKTDLGSFRFSDPERNIFVASTDMPGLSKAPLVYEKQGGMMRNSKKKEKKLLPHYSVTNQGDALWGTHDVYADNLASPDRVKLQINYE